MADSIDGRAREITWGWWLVVLVGVLSVVAGVIILLEPSESLATLAVIAGIFFLLDGILELADSLMRSTSNRGLVALIGVMSAIVGVAGAAIAVACAYILRGPGGDPISRAAGSGVLDEGSLAAKQKLSQGIDRGEVTPPGI